MDLLKLIDPKDLIDFSQNFSITRNYLGEIVPGPENAELESRVLTADGRHDVADDGVGARL